LFKLLSPQHLLKLPFANDSNSFDKGFYNELLHIIGLTETKEGNKKLIGRKPQGERNAGSMLENAIVQLDSLDKINRLDRPSQYGATHDERLFTVALELCITWVNRILFLKLLEAQLISYHKKEGVSDYKFLSLPKINNYDDLNSLFFQVLARQPQDRNAGVQALFDKVPYLNSSLFEPTELEHTALFISNLRNEKAIPIRAATVLKNDQGKKQTGQLTTLAYLFGFLDAYDSGSEGGESIQEDNKTLINASVLGLIFEKINGYKDGSFFTPGFVTMYMCRETIRKAFVQKVNECFIANGHQNWVPLQTVTDVYNRIGNGIGKESINEVINNLKICDPAVGSGHFLMSALNELIVLKSELGALIDKDRKRIKHHIEVINDELVITDEDGQLFEYNPNNKETRRIQETLFHEKQALIENCLFGVDINPNSVKICRLRLWIELLKSAYCILPGQECGAAIDTRPSKFPSAYIATKEELIKPPRPRNLQSFAQLQTLPNIDINIKCGNSLVSRFAMDADLSQALKKSRWNIESYKIAVDTYRNATDKAQKREMERLIADIKSDFRSEIAKNDPKIRKLEKLQSDFNLLTVPFLLSDKNTGLSSKSNLKKAKEREEKLSQEISRLSNDIEEIQANKIYENAFEWRFEFPEVLNNNGDFVGFDIMLGNPPYIRQEEIKDQKSYLQSNFTTYSGSADLYVFFVEKAFQILQKDGRFNFIIPNKWMQAGYGKPLRSFLLQKQLVSIVDFGDLQVFDEATAYPCILELANMLPAIQFKSTALKNLNFGSNFSKFVQNQADEIQTNSLTDETWILSNPKDQRILSKLKENCISLADYVGGEAHYGIKTGLTEAFVIDEETRNRIAAEDEKSKEILRPVLRGRDIKPYRAQSSSMWLIGTSPTLNLDIENYQGVKNHLLTFGKNRLEQSGEPNSRKKSSNQWFETQDNIGYW